MPGDALVYSPAVAALLEPPRLAELGPGSPNTAAKAALASFDPMSDLGRPVKDRDAARACHSGLWLLHDFLDESHGISQDLDTAEGSFWHAIMHRREGDFSNSKYWYARCAGHPSQATLAAQAPRLINTMPADKAMLRLIATGWNAPAFVDLVEQVHEHPSDPRHAAAVALQRLEWQVLFDHCTRAAAG